VGARWNLHPGRVRVLLFVGLITLATGVPLAYWIERRFPLRDDIQLEYVNQRLRELDEESPTAP
jgi:hypothetical protein